MNNTALRAEAQSANNTHMVFANEEHEKFYGCLTLLFNIISQKSFI